jgi:hypothetical protein
LFHLWSLKADIRDQIHNYLWFHLRLTQRRSSRREKILKIFFSLAATSAFGQLPNSTLNTPVVISSDPSLPSVEVSKNLDFQKFPIEYSSFETDLKEEIFEIMSSPNIVKWFSLESLEDFPTLGFASPPLVKISSSKEKENSSPLQTLPSSSKTQPSAVKTEISPSYISFSPKLYTVKFPSPPCSP